MLPYFFLLLSFPICIYNIVTQALGVVPGITDEMSLTALISVLTDESALQGIGLSLYIAFASTIPACIIGVVSAWCIATLARETSLGGIIAKLPQQIPHAVACILMVNMFLPSGLLARVLFALGFQDASALFSSALYFPNSFGIIVEYIWKESAFFCFMLLPSMSGISASLSEASHNLGASRLRTFISVVIPNCMPTIRTCIIIVFVVTFGAYETPALLGNVVTKSLPVMAYAEYSFSNLAMHRPIAMALNLVMILLATGISFAYYYYGVKKDQRIRGQR